MGAPSVSFVLVSGGSQVQSPTANPPFLPAVSTYLQEGNASVWTVSFTDENGLPMTPQTIVWNLSDDKGNIINWRHDVPIAVPAQSVTIVLTGEDTMRLTFDDDMRCLKVSGTYNSSNGQGLTFAAQYYFGLIPLAVET